MSDSTNHRKEEIIASSHQVTASEAIPSLLAYYSGPRSDPKAFLRAWAKLPTKTFDEGHRKIVLQKFTEVDPTFERTVGLAIKAFVTPSLAGSVLQWTGKVVQEVLAVEKGWSYDPSKEGYDTFFEIAKYLREDLAPSRGNTKGERQIAKKRSDRAARILMTAMLWLSYSRSLQIVDAIQAIKGTLPTRNEKEDGGQHIDRMALTTIAHSKFNQQRLREVIKLLTPWYGRINAFKNQLTLQTTEMEVLQRSLAVAEEIAQTRAESIESLEDNLSRLMIENEQLRKQVNDHQISAKHGRMEVITRERGLLTGKLKPLLQSAKEAAELMPPRAQVVKERLELAIEVIDQEDQWLQSSD
jgi:hypothetical protein